MGFGLYSLLEAALLVINSIVILNEERFLVKFGLDRNSLMSAATTQMPYGGAGAFGQPAPGSSGAGMMSPKNQLLNLLHSIRTVARVPLIGINIIVIIFKLLFG